jgi:nucleotide-binding universal stress UspA family protein
MSAAPITRQPRIVVGVDGSPTSKAALRWAIHQAELTGSTVDAVLAWEYPAAIAGFGWAPLPVTYDAAVETLADKTLAETVSEAAGPDPAVAVSPAVINGYPAAVLLRAAEGADLLVVGSRGHSEFTDALLGSVSQNCAHHAKCPVVIIRPDQPVSH